MTISTVNYRETIFDNPDVSKIMGVPTYETLHFLHNEVKSNAMSVHSNIRSRHYGYLILVVSPTAYALLTKNPFVCQFHT